MGLFYALRTQNNSCYDYAVFFHFGPLHDYIISQIEINVNIAFCDFYNQI